MSAWFSGYFSAWWSRSVGLVQWFFFGLVVEECRPGSSGASSSWLCSRWFKGSCWFRVILVRPLFCFVASSWFGWLYLETDASSGRLGVSSHQHVVRSARASAGAREGSRRLEPARPRWSPGPDSLKTTRGGEVRDRFRVSAHLSIRAAVLIKVISHHFLGVCVCAYECPWARLISRNCC